MSASAATFLRHPGVFLIVGAGNVTLKKYEHVPEATAGVELCCTQEYMYSHTLHKWTIYADTYTYIQCASAVPATVPACVCSSALVPQRIHVPKAQECYWTVELKTSVQNVVEDRKHQGDEPKEAREVLQQ